MKGARVCLQMFLFRLFCKQRLFCFMENMVLVCSIVVFCLKEAWDEDSNLLGCCPMLISKQLPKFWSIVLPSSHKHKQSKKSDHLSLTLSCLGLLKCEMKALWSSEMSVTTYQSTQCNIQKTWTVSKSTVATTNLLKHVMLIKISSIMLLVPVT
jgi:hypothetical protein